MIYQWFDKYGEGPFIYDSITASKAGISSYMMGDGTTCSSVQTGRGCVEVQDTDFIIVGQDRKYVMTEQDYLLMKEFILTNARSQNS